MYIHERYIKMQPVKRSQIKVVPERNTANCTVRNVEFEDLGWWYEIEQFYYDLVD